MSPPAQLPLGMPPVLYDERFLASHVGKTLLSDPKVAVVELIANAWDAGATKVRISWPESGTTKPMVVEDDGVGMTEQQFNHRWRTLYYNRQAEQGDKVEFPSDGPTLERYAFGRNGLGRWASFCFGEDFTVETWRDGRYNKYKVEKGTTQPFRITQLVTDKVATGHGTRIAVEKPRSIIINPSQIRNEIGMRFLTDPNFRVEVNGVGVTFADIRDNNISSEQLATADGHTVELVAINTLTTDRTARQHGIAWHVRGRLVGSCSWDMPGKSPDDPVVDQRKVVARRMTFVVKADHLAELGAVRSDWTGFDLENQAFMACASAVYTRVGDLLLLHSEEDRREIRHRALGANYEAVRQMSPLQLQTWTNFVDEAQIACPSIRETDIVKLSKVVANLEQSKSRYSLLAKLGSYKPDELDQLDELLDQWTLGMAKEVLDEISVRLRLIEELQGKLPHAATREVQDLQPLFEKGLWIFGPEFETIEYTSNAGMTRVVQELFKSKTRASLNRPDFAVLPDGTVGLYSMPLYDPEMAECGVERLVVIELKKPGVTIAGKQKEQCWKYVKELFELGQLQEGRSKVRCFVLGKSIEKFEDKAREELDGAVTITPLLFDTVMARAKSRMLKLCDRVKNAPFLVQHRTELEKFLAPPVPVDLFTAPEEA